MQVTDVASAAWVFASAPSKVPFYVAGSVLAGWAVLSAAYGVTHGGFPASLGQQRLFMGTTFVLVAATLTAAVATGGEAEPRAAPGEPAAQAPPSKALELVSDPSGAPAYDKKRATVRAGEVEIRFTNRSPVPHDVTVARGQKVLAATKTIRDATATRTASLAAGDYVYFCSVDAHRQAGMEGALTVR
jgi:plastocyanin